MKAAPAPLFNYRKRQCQAILSGPQQLTTSVSTLETTRSASNYADTESDRRPTSQTFPGSKQNVAGSTSKINRNIDQRETFPSMAKAGNNVQKLAQNPFRHTNPGLMNVKGKFVAGGAAVNMWNKNESSKGGSRYQFSHSHEMNGPHNSYNQGNGLQGNTTASHGAKPMVNCNITSRREPCNNIAASSSLMNSKPTAVNFAGNQRKSSNDYNFSGNTSKVTSSVFSSNQRNQQDLSNGYSKGSACQSVTSTCSETNDSISRARNEQARQAQSYFKTQSNNSAAQWNKAGNIQHRANNASQSNSMDSIFKDELYHPPSKDSHQKNRVAQLKKTADSSATQNLSLRILTCTIGMLRSWTAKRNCVGLFMFEVYGVIDSALVRDRSGTGKEFILRDGTSTITCIFYEIDRELPRLIRGQMCRVVGSMADKLDVLRVVSVRSAHADERLVCQAATELSQDEMDKLII